MNRCVVTEISYLQRICSAVFSWMTFSVYFFHYSITLRKICTAAKVKKQSFRGFPSEILSKGFAKIFNHLSSHFQNSQEAIFQKHLSVASFKITNINSSFSFIFIYFLQLLQIVFHNTFFLLVSVYIVLFVSLCLWWVNRLYKPNL